MGLVRVANLAEIDEGGVLEVEAEGRTVCLARVGGTVYAFANNCSHRDFPLSQGELDPDDCSITCEWHGARFDIRTGHPLSLPATRPIAVYPCQVKDDMVFVDVG